MSQEIYGFPSPMPLDVDFYTLSNEDIGFVASLVDTTNHVEAFALPFPSSVDLFEETIVAHAIEFLFLHPNYPSDDSWGWLSAYMSMLDKEFSATFTGAMADANDENWKAQFAGPISFGISHAHPTDAALASPWQWKSDVVTNAIYFFPVPLRLVTPLYIQLLNQTATIDPATQDETAVDFTLFERVSIRVWFTRSKLTSAERDSRNVAMRFQHLDS